jgi:hypothetical protein
LRFCDAPISSYQHRHGWDEKQGEFQERAEGLPRFGQDIDAQQHLRCQHDRSGRAKRCQRERQDTPEDIALYQLHYGTHQPAVRPERNGPRPCAATTIRDRHTRPEAAWNGRLAKNRRMSTVKNFITVSVSQIQSCISIRWSNLCRSRRRDIQVLPVVLTTFAVMTGKHLLSSREKLLPASRKTAKCLRLRLKPPRSAVKSGIIARVTIHVP